ncbi:MarR family winged helix-turn-helix transcriptional regulator [Kitasatospora sp. NPDC056531]|uniref:MarR family winged helix-turn-helix transcriptional regulator n=1 Tax=Kitasatospora sp. NPDC056531 TaxID=3345856 RepID=UPI003674AD23
MAEPDDGEAELSLLSLLLRNARRFQGELARRLDEAGVEPTTPAHMTVLAHLRDGDALSIAELARRAGVTRQTMHRAVHRLTDERLLVTEPGAGFPRSALVRLTDRGVRRREVAARILADLEGELAAQLGTQSVTTLRETLCEALHHPWPPHHDPPLEGLT